MQRPMSVNDYSWVEGNVVNAVDPSGNQFRIPGFEEGEGGGGGGGVILLLLALYTAAIAPSPGPGGTTNNPFLEELAEEFNDGLCDARDGLLSLFGDISSSDANTNTDTAENVQEDEDTDDDNCEHVGYHGTSSNSVSSLLRDGIDSNQLDSGAQLGIGFYVTPDEDVAWAYGYAAADGDVSQIGILRVCAINYSQMTSIEVPENHWNPGFEQGKGLPPRYLVDYDYLTSKIADTDNDRQIKFNLHMLPRLRLSSHVKGA